MTAFEIGLWSFPVLLTLIALRIPVAAAMFAVGLAGTYLINGNMRMVDSQLKTFAYGTFTSYSLSIIPLFLLMSEFATRGGMSALLFRAAQAWLGHRRGGLAMAAVGASAGFGAICGSSLATASSVGRVAIPELERAGYSGALATGSLAAGGTLGILIPPSVLLVIYAILAEMNIEKLFAAAFIPGILAMVGYMIAIAITVRLNPQFTSANQRKTYRERLYITFEIWPVILIFLAVIGGIYLGVFSPTAAAAVGVAGTALVAYKNLTWDSVGRSLLATGKISAMIFFIILGASVFNSFLSAAKVPQTLAQFFLDSGSSPWFVLIGMLLLYLILGTVMDSMAMIFLTVPVFVPIISELDFGLPIDEKGIWFGILVLMSAEIGLITPPVGLNLFVINALAKNTPIKDTYIGVIPFVISDILRVVILVSFPAISLYLVRILY